MTDDLVISVNPLGFPWETVDPFLFCVHHVDAYPAGDERMGPSVSLRGRNLGNGGGWPWPSHGPVHARDERRFAKHPDGRVERPG